MTIQRAVAEALGSLDEVFTSPPRSSEVSKALRKALDNATGPTHQGIPEALLDQVATLMESDRQLTREDILNLALSQHGVTLRSLRPYLLEERLRQRIEKVARKGDFDFLETEQGFHATKLTDGWTLEYTLRAPHLRAESEAVFSVGLTRKTAVDWQDLLHRPAVEELGRRFGISVKLPDALGGDWLTAKGGLPAVLATLRRASDRQVPEDTLRACEGVEIANKGLVEVSDVWFDLVVLKDDPALPEAGEELEVGISSLLRASWDQLKGLTVRGLEALR